MEYICMRTRKTTPPTYTHKERERWRERERTNKVCVLDACDRIEDCRREREGERERESRSPGEGEVVFYASKTDINHVSI